jgi:hypothetical protein
MKLQVNLFYVLIAMFFSFSYSQTKFGTSLGLNTSRFTDEFKTINVLI